MAFTKAQLDAYIQGLYDDDGQLDAADNQLIINFILSNGNPEIDPRDLIQIRRGDLLELPNLAQGEMAITLDSESLFVGGLNGNIESAMLKDLSSVNVRKSGAKGDGVTDDHSKLQSFITSNAGKIIDLERNKSYLISESLVIPENTVLNGNGSKIFNNYLNIYLIKPQSNTVLIDLEIEGTGNTVVDIGNRGISIEGLSATSFTENVKIINCNIHGIGFYGIYGEFAKDVVISNNTLKDLGYAGVLFLSGENIKVFNNLIDGIPVGSAGNSYGVSFTRDAISTDLSLYPRSKNCFAIGNTIRNIPNWDAIDSHAGDTIIVMNNIIENCKGGISFVSNTIYATINSIISQNKVKGSINSFGARVVGKFGTVGTPIAYSENNKINNNVFIECGIEGNTNMGAVYCESTKNLIVNNNNIDKSYVNGICLYTDNKGFVLNGNSIKDTQSSGVTANGVGIRSEYNEGIIDGNNLMRDNTSLNVSVMLYGVNMTVATNNSITYGVNRVTADIHNNGIRGEAVKFHELGNKVNLYVGINSPEGTITANVGSLFISTNGGAGTTFFVKQSGVGNTGWVGK